MHRFGFQKRQKSNKNRFFLQFFSKKIDFPIQNFDFSFTEQQKKKKKKKNFKKKK
jgi:hypothetical protein